MPILNKPHKANTVLLVASMILSTMLSAQSIYLEDFDLAAGTTVDNGSTAWSRDISNTNLGGQGFFEVRSDNGSLSFQGADLDGEAVWLSEIMDVSSFTTVTASVSIAEQGRMEGSDYIRLYYVVDGGPEILFGDFTNDFGSTFQTVTSPSIIGSNLQIIIRVNNNRINEVHSFDDVFITGSTSEASTYLEDFDLPTGTIVDNGPTAWSRDISNANLGGQGFFEVRSDNGSLIFQGADLDGEAVWLSEIIDISSFATTTASVAIAEQGRMEASDYIRLYYVVDGGPEILFGDFSNDFGSTFQTVTSPSITGSNLQIIIRVNNNRVNEVHSFDDVWINGSTTEISTYLEDFDLPTGTIVDNGPTAWSRDISNANLGGQGFFEVRSDNGSLIFQGADLDGEAVWLSEVVDISSFVAATASVSIAEQGRMEGSDYMRLYYVVDGGPEMLFGDFNNDFGSTFQTVTSPSIIGSDLQIVIRVDNNRPDEFHAFDNVMIIGSSPGGTELYSRQNANWDNYDAWSIAALGGSSCNCIPDATTDVIIGDGYSIDLNDDADVRNITIHDSGTLQWNSAHDLNIRYNGNVIVHNNGNMDNNGLGGAVLNIAEVDNNTFSLLVDGNLSVGQININGGNSILNILDGSGSIDVENSLTFYADDVLVNNNHKGTFTIQNDLILSGNNSSFVNNDTIDVGGNLSYNHPLGAINSNISFSNNGILNVSNDIQSSEAGSQFTNGPSALLNVNNIQTFINNGITLNNTGTIDMTGEFLTVDALSSFINLTGGVWNYQGSNPDPDTRLFTGASNNSFNYNGVNQQVIVPQDHYWHLNLLGTGTKNTMANLDINGDLIISGSCQLDIASGLHDMAIAGDCFTTSTNPHALIEGTQTIIFDGPADQILASNGGNLYNIMVNKSGGRISLTQPLNLLGSLNFNSATEFASNGNLTLISTSDGTAGNAMIGEILNGASVTGDVSVQRFISGEGEIWRYISSPVSDATVADWQDDFPITGTFADPSTGPGINSSRASLYHYGESSSGTELQLGWMAYPTSGTAASNNIIPGGGYTALMINGTNPTTVEVSGVINQGNLNFDVSFAGSGWNLLGNPYPATIDWSSTTGWVSSGLANAIYIRNNENGNSNSTVASFVDGIGTNGGTGFVATGQSFWVQAIAANPSLQINERAKSGNTGAFFRKSRDDNWFRVTLRNEAQFDETVIRFSEEATLEYDITKDAKKFTNGGINLSTFVDSQSSMAIKFITNANLLQAIKPKIGKNQAWKLQP